VEDDIVRPKKAKTVRGKKLKALTNKTCNVPDDNFYTDSVTKIFDSIKEKGLSLDQQGVDDGM